MKQYIKSIIVLFCIALCIPSQAQEFVFGYSLGKANYQMGDMKSLLENDVKNRVQYVNETYETNFKYKNIENFPGGLFHNAYFGLKFSFHEIGLQYDYLTTGGRNHITDYSGEMRKDMIFSGDALGIYYKMHFLSIPLAKNFRFSTYASVATGAIFNQGHADYFFDLYGPRFYNPPYITSQGKFETVDNSYKWHSTNWYVQPGIGLQFWFKNTVSLSFNAGYLLDNAGKIRTADENTLNDQILYIPGYGTTTISQSSPGKEYDFGANWSGLRLSVGIGFAFSVKK